MTVPRTVPHPETRGATGQATGPGPSPPTSPLPPSPRDALGARGVLVALGAIGAGFLAALCCVGPLVFVAFGVGAGLASAFEPLRPLFTVLTLGFLAVGFYVVYGRRPSPVAAAGACGSDGSCAVPRRRTRDQILLWGATVLALLLLTFPRWSVLFI